MKLEINEKEILDVGFLLLYSTEGVANAFNKLSKNKKPTKEDKIAMERFKYLAKIGAKYATKLDNYIEKNQETLNI